MVTTGLTENVRVSCKRWNCMRSSCSHHCYRLIGSGKWMLHAIDTRFHCPANIKSLRINCHSYSKSMRLINSCLYLLFRIVTREFDEICSILKIFPYCFTPIIRPTSFTYLTVDLVMYRQTFGTVTAGRSNQLSGSKHPRPWYTVGCNPFFQSKRNVVLRPRVTNACYATLDEVSQLLNTA